jgi:uncharacterized protein YggE
MTFGIFAATALFLSPNMAVAQPGQETTPTLLSVSAEGLSEAPPDLATVTLGVSARGETAQAAMAENSRLMDALMQALRNAGVAGRDIQTAQLNVSPRYRYADNEEPTLVGYEATNTVDVEVHRVARTGAIVSAAIEAGGNVVQRITFAHQNPSAQRDIARREAAAEARRRADLYAGSFGLRVVRVVSISEPGASVPGEEIVVTASRRSSVQSAPVVAVSPGEITTQARLSVTFELR